MSEKKTREIADEDIEFIMDLYHVWTKDIKVTPDFHAKLKPMIKEALEQRLEATPAKSAPTFEERESNLSKRTSESQSSVEPKSEKKRVHQSVNSVGSKPQITKIDHFTRPGAPPNRNAIRSVEIAVPEPLSSGDAKPDTIRLSKADKFNLIPKPLSSKDDPSEYTQTLSVLQASVQKQIRDRFDIAKQVAVRYDNIVFERTADVVSWKI